MFKNKNKFLLIIFGLALLGAAALFWAQQQHYPKQAVEVAQDFVDQILKNDLKLAYQLTTDQSQFKQFNSFEEFQLVVKNNGSLNSKDRNNIQVKIRKIFPFQSNGNRIRRWLNDQPAEMSQVSIDFIIEDSVSGHILPFEVREVHLGNHQWRVAYFQSHAL